MIWLLWAVVLCALLVAVAGCVWHLKTPIVYSAWYGDADVTVAVREMVARGEYRFVASNGTFGFDPCRGRLKLFQAVCAVNAFDVRVIAKYEGGLVDMRGGNATATHFHA